MPDTIDVVVDTSNATAFLEECRSSITDKEAEEHLSDYEIVGFRHAIQDWDVGYIEAYKTIAKLRRAILGRFKVKP